MTRVLPFQSCIPSKTNCLVCAVRQARCPNLQKAHKHRATQHRQYILASATTEKDVQKVQEASDGQTDADRNNGGELLSWQQIGQEAGSDTLNGYQLLDNSPLDGHPRTAPTTVLASHESTTTDKPVLFYRDTNAWCPFCERVWFALEEKHIEYDTVLINLQNKPDWFKELVPTQLVPAVKINGKLVYESFDILMALEEQFPDTPLLPHNSELRDEVHEACKHASEVQSAGYKYMSSQMKKDAQDPDAKQEAEDAFLFCLDKMEEQLSKHKGPYLVGDFGMADIVHCSAMERFAANMPHIVGLDLRKSPHYPNIARWYAVMDRRSAYQKVKSDDTTLNLVIRKVFGFPLAVAPSTPNEFVKLGRIEAAAKLCKNREVVRADIIKRSGILRGHDSSSGASNGSDQATSVPHGLQDAVDHAMRRLASYLLSGQPGPKPEDAESRAIAAASMAYFRNRASAPRDLSANACHELREACLAVVTDSY